MDISKPLVRWTIGGNPHKYGFLCLQKSIESFLDLYKEEFDYVICYNNLDKDQKSFLRSISKKFAVPLRKQSRCKEMSYKPKGPAWKLYPPRLRPQSHEIFIDNDLVIHGKSEIVDEFLKSRKHSFISEGHGNYGKYNKYINTETHVNSGFFGIPPNFPFAELMCMYQQQDEVKSWEDYFDEQGLVASCLLNHTNCKIIKLNEIHMSESEYVKTPIGCHFVKINDGPTDNWNQYMQAKL